MSLFKILPWFLYQSPDSDQNYDSFSLTCARLSSDNEQQKDNIIITSHSGMIAILQPSICDTDNLEEQQHYHSSIVYEAKLNEPILAVLCGNFIQYSQRQERQNSNIAILHPRKLIIYALVTSTGFAEHGQQSKLQILHQHELEKLTFTMCKGNFGGVKGKEFICVMFLDGSLKFFEQDGISQNCIIPGNHTIPTNFIYVPRTDCFIILAPNWDLECYRYLNLSESYERKFSPIWSLNVGEYILDFNSHQISNNESLIVLLGENNLICVSDTGKMKFIKKLDYSPLCFCSFVQGWYFEPDCKLMIAVATENRSLLIYHHSTLIWCAELLDESIAITRANFMGLAGGLVTLNSTGKVTVGFLGSDPNVFKVPPINLSKLDYEKSKCELEEMEKEISSSVDNSDVPFINAAAEKDLQIKSHLQFEDLDEGEFCRFHVVLLPTVNLEQVQLFMTENPAFVIPENVFFFKDLKAQDKYSFETTIYPSESHISELFSAELIIMISFINKQSIARVMKHLVEIPLNKVAKTSTPQKDGNFRVTFTVQQPVNFGDVFSDLNPPEIGQAIGFSTLNTDSISTLIVSKSSNRYRLQSNSIAALSFLLSFVVEKISTLPEGKVSKAVTVKTIPSSTIEFLLTTIEKHHNMKNEMKGIIDTLSAKTIEMRLFERCFLVKMQGKAASHSMEGINMLLRDTYKQILALTNKHKTIKVHMRRVQVQLASTIHFIRKVIEYADLPQQKITENLLCIMRPADFRNQSWCEAVAPYVDYIYSMHQTRTNQNQFYENFSFRNDNFSLTRFNKQLKLILSVVVESIDTTNNAEKILAEQPEPIDNESEWSSKFNSTFDNNL